MRHAGPLTAAVVAATTVTTLLVGSTGAIAETEGHRPDSAFGISVSGLLPVAPTPYVESRDGKPVSAAGFKLGSLQAGGLGKGDLLVSAEHGKAESTAKHVGLLEYLQADLISTWCEDGEGGVEFKNLSVLGKEIRSGTVHDKTIPLGPLGSMTLGAQEHHGDGSTTVTGVVLTLFPAATGPAELLTPDQKSAMADLGLPKSLATVGDAVAGMGQEFAEAGEHVFTIGSATCNPYGHGSDEGDGHGDTEDADHHSDLPSAPAPDVVEAHLPVTG